MLIEAVIATQSFTSITHQCGDPNDIFTFDAIDLGMLFVLNLPHFGYVTD
jgi:hypothetical protein